MKTALFDYTLPPELIAQEPCRERDQARMMVFYRETGRIEHRNVCDLPEYLRHGDLLVLNNTRVLHARLFARKAATGGKVELLLLEDVGGGSWDVLLRASRRPVPGDRLELFDGQASAVLEQDGELGRARIRVESSRPFHELVEAFGIPPLPPYIKRAPEGAAEDRERYQTVYAEQSGAVAAPTAGLHFTPELFSRLQQQGVDRTFVTLHVGIGTFRPVSAEELEDHRMEEERYEVTEETAERVNRCRREGGRIVAVGSTSVRTLETCAGEDGLLHPGKGRSGIFIHPPYRFRAVDVMLTNFHLPNSTLLMMISALAGREKILEAYRVAVEERYRFFSYGDCMLIL